MNIEKYIIKCDIEPALKWVSNNVITNPSGRVNPNSNKYREIGAQYTVPRIDEFKYLFAFIEQYGNPSDVWINYNPPGSRNKYHYHSDSDIAGCWYLSVPTNSGQLVFETGERIEPAPYSVYLWDARKLHKVTTNLSDSNRISVAFNIKRIRDE
jgi:hypothetical protein